jgi:F-type H+/Na+-transporting ATPase subunit alpha
MTVRSDEIASIIRGEIESFGTQIQQSDVGTVVESGDGVVRIHGMGGALYGELIEFPRDNGDAIVGLALNLEEDAVSAVVLGDYLEIKEGDQARSTGRVAEVPVGPSLIGRVINPLGVPLDGRGPIDSTTVRPVERVAPNVVNRQAVNVPMLTGIKSIDAMFPIGRGQRELIIGDRSIGKTAIAIDAIINQRGSNVVCIYVAIGQKASKVSQLVGKLQETGAMEYTVIVSATASDPAALQYLAPYAGCAIGEEVMERGGDALIVYDDLSKHAVAYRQMSLLLRRPPGREAYPGDVFYLHSRLLERSARLSAELGSGSLTALPIIETQAGDISAYVPTNVISITDGQIFVESDLFNAGQRPAISVGLSVSRVGGNAQTKAMKQVAGKLKLDLAQYSELQAFAQFGTSDLDASTRRQLERGQRATEVLKQPQYAPLSVDEEVEILYALNNGYLDDVPVDRIHAFEDAFHKFMRTSHPDIGDAIRNEKIISEASEKALTAAISEFKSTVPY